MEDYYVYVYLDPLKPGEFKYDSYSFNFEPFYIGKGKDKRHSKHLVNCFYKKNKSAYRRTFYRKLRKLINSGNTPIILLFKEHLTEQESFNIETSMISKIGRRTTKTGPLCNLDEGGLGSSVFGKITKKIYVYNDLGELISIENNMMECSRKFNIPQGTIFKSVHGKRKSPKNGYRFRNVYKSSIDQVNPNEVYLVNRPVFLYNKSGEFIRSFKTAREAEKELKDVSLGMIRSNVVGLVKICKNKYIFKYN